VSDHDTVTAARAAAPGSDCGAFQYDAFISCFHKDREAAAGVQNGPHHVGRRIRQVRALRVFRDDTDLTVTPDLPDTVTAAVDSSRYPFVVLSQSAAALPWVAIEVDRSGLLRSFSERTFDETREGPDAH
jgi:hypothetical protein